MKVLKFWFLCFLNLLLLSVHSQDIKIVKIGQQIWSFENLSTLTFQNGDSIRVVKTKEEWVFCTENQIPACVAYQFEEENATTFGLLYNWFAVADKRNLAPKGFRIPSAADFEKLLENQGKWAAQSLKSAGYWENEACRACSLNGENCGTCQEERRSIKRKSVGAGNNSSGFNALPAGIIDSNGYFDKIDNQTVFWTSTQVENSAELVYCLPLRFGFNDAYLSSNLKGMGFSVRVVIEGGK